MLASMDGPALHDTSTVWRDVFGGKREFDTFDEFSALFSRFEKRSKYLFRVKNSSSVEAENRRRKDQIDAAIKYSGLVLCCVNSELGHGKPPSNNRWGPCKAHVYLRYRSQSRRLAIMTSSLVHNHPQEEGAAIATRVCVTERLGKHKDRLAPRRKGARGSSTIKFSPSHGGGVDPSLLLHRNQRPSLPSGPPHLSGTPLDLTNPPTFMGTNGNGAFTTGTAPTNGSVLPPTSSVAGLSSLSMFSSLPFLLPPAPGGSGYLMRDVSGNGSPETLLQRPHLTPPGALPFLAGFPNPEALSTLLGQRLVNFSQNHARLPSLLQPPIFPSNQNPTGVVTSSEEAESANEDVDVTGQDDQDEPMTEEPEEGTVHDLRLRVKKSSSPTPVPPIQLKQEIVDEEEDTRPDSPNLQHMQISVRWQQLEPLFRFCNKCGASVQSRDFQPNNSQNSLVVITRCSNGHAIPWNSLGAENGSPGTA